MHIASWDPNGSTSLGNNDEPGKDLIQRMASVYDYVYPLLSEPERKVVRRCFSIRMHQLYLGLKRLPFEVNPFDSHAMGSYLDHLTEACIAMAGELDVEEPLEYCLMMLWAPFFPPYGGADGGWSEGPGYWGWSVADWLRDFRYVEQATGVPIHQRAWLRNTGYFELYGNPPYSKLSPFGDGSDTRGNGDVDMWELARTFHNPYFKWYADQLKYRPHGLLAFLDYGQEVAGKAPHDLPQGRCFNDVGLACMHDYLWDGEKNVEVLMRSSPYGSISHSYADQNAFVLSGYGEPLAISSGYYPYYGSPHHRGWTWQTKAANSIGVDGEGQQIRDWNAKGRILHFESNDYYHYALGDATAAYRGRLQRFYRHILYVRPLDSEMTPIVVIYDDLISRKKSTFQWWLHALEQMRIDGASQSVEIKRNQAQLDVRFLAPISLRFSQTDQFTIPPEGDADQYPNQWHLTAETTEPSESCRFLTVFFPHKVDQRDGSRSTKLLSGRGYLGVEVVAQGRRHVTRSASVRVPRNH